MFFYSTSFLHGPYICFVLLFFFSSRRRHTRWPRDWSSDVWLFRSHGYTVIPKSLEQTPLKVTFVNNNDQTTEGLKHKHVPAFSVQFHPEAGPGPADSGCLYDDFLRSEERRVGKEGRCVGPE